MTIYCEQIVHIERRWLRPIFVTGHLVSLQGNGASFSVNNHSKIKGPTWHTFVARIFYKLCPIALVEVYTFRPNIATSVPLYVSVPITA